MTILEKIKFEEDWLSEVNLTKENMKIALAGIRATVREQQPCDDCISREETLKYSHIEYDDDGVGHRVIYTEDIEELPPVQPQQKVGKWIDAVLPNDNGGLPVQVCNQCNTFYPLSYTGGGHNYCPNCGAKMEVK